jgi:hypothetical protein
LWLTLGLVFVLGLLVYGIMVPSPPSAFDLPEAQVPNTSPRPWDSVRPL